MESDASKYLTCSEASKLLPGRPSANCVWRWARRGVQSRGGERIRLQHVRMGGALYTTADWIDEFGRSLAEADARHFDGLSGELRTVPAHTTASKNDDHRTRELDEIDEQLGRAGI